MDRAPVEGRYRAGSPRSNAAFERVRKTMPGGVKGAYFYRPYPLTVERGEGCYLQEYYGIEPDLTTYGKIIGGGFPVGAFGGRADIMDLLDTSRGPTGFFQSGTFSGHPVAMAAGLATLRELTPAAFDHLNALGGRLREGLNERFRSRKVEAQAVGTGSLFSIHFTAEKVVNYRNLARTDQGTGPPVDAGTDRPGVLLEQRTHHERPLPVHGRNARGRTDRGSGEGHSITGGRTICAT